jgi:serine/threonine protein kinase
MATSPQDILGIGTLLDDKWVILELVGKGGMAEVYRAHQLNLKRDVAIKVISREWLKLLSSDEEEIESTAARFRREVQAMAQVRHPNVLQIFDYGSSLITKDGAETPVEYIAMEYVPGATLRATMSDEGFYPDDDRMKTWLTEYFLPVLDGVQAIHALGMVHRDLKPENVLLDGAIPKISDFGLARSCRLKPVTRDIDIKGTPPYMPPEQFFDFGRVDERADMYSLGKILFEAAAGKISPEALPFKSARLPEAETLFFQKLDSIIQETTAEDRDRRLATVEKLRTALLEAISMVEREDASRAVEPPVPSSVFARPRWIWTGIAVAVVSVFAMALWHLTRWAENSSTKSPGGPVPGTELSQPGGPPSSEAVSPAPEAPARSIVGRDGVKMVLLPGGDLRIPGKSPETPEKVIQVPNLYMDNTVVTNHNFLEFLNDVKDTLTVEGGVVVTKKGEIWFYLGEGTEPYEQIVYRDGRFLLRDPRYAGDPVVRVTWYGASAYARYYDERLPTEYEWEYAARKGFFRGGVSPESPENTQPPGSQDTAAGPTSGYPTHMESMMGTSPPASEHSLRSGEAYRGGGLGLTDVGAIVKEWTDQGKSGIAPGADGPNAPYPSLVMAAPIGRGAPGPRRAERIFRYPWEGPPDVGFRCVQDVNAQG